MAKRWHTTTISSPILTNTANTWANGLILPMCRLSSFSILTLPSVPRAMFNRFSWQKQNPLLKLTEVWISLLPLFLTLLQPHSLATSQPAPSPNPNSTSTAFPSSPPAAQNCSGTDGLYLLWQVAVPNSLLHVHVPFAMADLSQIERPLVLALWIPLTSPKSSGALLKPSLV